MATVTKAKLADQQTKDLIFGYLKETQLPHLVECLTLVYYNNPEYFEKYRRDCFKISNDGSTITKVKNASSNQSDTVFGHRQIASSINDVITWKFDMEKCEHCILGITSQPKSEENAYTGSGYNSGRHLNYCFFATKDIQRLFQSRKALHRVDLKLDLSYTLYFGRLSIIIHGEQEKEMFLDQNIVKDDDINYRLTIEMEHTGDAISIIDYDQRKGAEEVIEYESDSEYDDV